MVSYWGQPSTCYLAIKLEKYTECPADQIVKYKLNIKKRTYYLHVSENTSTFTARNYSYLQSCWNIVYIITCYFSVIISLYYPNRNRGSINSWCRLFNRNKNLRVSLTRSTGRTALLMLLTNYFQAVYALQRSTKAIEPYLAVNSTLTRRGAIGVQSTSPYN